MPPSGQVIISRLNQKVGQVVMSCLRNLLQPGLLRDHIANATVLNMQEGNVGMLFT